MYKLNSFQDNTWFCILEHLYAYKAAKDIEWNPNCNLWIRVKHYTESTHNAGHSYDLNQSRIYRLAQIQLVGNTEALAQALELLETDHSNQDFTDDEINIIMRADHVELTETEEEELQRILNESFDISHLDFDAQRAIQNLQRQF